MPPNHFFFIYTMGEYRMDRCGVLNMLHFFKTRTPNQYKVILAWLILFPLFLYYVQYTDERITAEVIVVMFKSIYAGVLIILGFMISVHCIIHFFKKTKV